MPFASEAQRKMMWAKHPDIAAKWAHGQHADGSPISGNSNSKVSKDAVKRRLANLHKKKKKGGKNADSKAPTDQNAKSGKPPWLK